ncbi:MAG: excinuclease ABC subunit UvrC [Bacillota bacterium]|nr:excinuclease ABC subunit UvrC [Bacillota bacterium]
MEDPRELLLAQVQQLPHSPGVYLFKDKKDKIIYVGKALNLRNRVRSYFQKPSLSAPRLRILVENISYFSFIITDSEAEAFMLESNLIKEHSPRYNVQFKDDKHYPYLRLTTEEPFPRLEVARRVERKGSKYFGPYSKAGSMRETIRLIKKLFPLRSCRQQLVDGETKGRPCLNYQIKRCLAPCRGDLSSQEYSSVVEQVALFLEGRQLSLLKKIEKEMNAAANEMEFEKAARLRDQYFSLQRLMERQKAVTNDLKDRDIIALVELAQVFTVGLFRIRGGKLLGSEYFHPKGTTDAEAGEVMKEFLRQYYDQGSYIPPELLLSHLPAEDVLLSEWLRIQRNNKKVKLKVPVRGEKKSLVDLVKKNALLHIKQEKEDLQVRESSLEKLAKILGLKDAPSRIEGYDISHYAGQGTVGSMVVFMEGKPWKEGYRRYKIRQAGPADDYGALAEMLQRRFLNTELPYPSLILIDGGRGQLSTAQSVLEENGLQDIPPAALAKEQEHIFIPGQRAPLILPASDPALKLLQQVRDEAHRFAVSFSRDLMLKSSLSSFLEDIPGIGKVRRKAILKHFTDLEAVINASLDEIKSVPAMNRTTAERLYKELQTKNSVLRRQ